MCTAENRPKHFTIAGIVEMAERASQSTPLITRMSRKLLFISLIIVIVFAVHPRRAFAQAGAAGFTNPINISRSGAAGGPQIVISPDQEVQVFWWDRFNGLTSSTLVDAGGSQGYTWSEPFMAPIASSTLKSTPQIGADQAGFAHAFWWDTVPGGILQRSFTKIGTRSWSTPNLVGDAILTFDFKPRQPEGFYLAYLRADQTEEQPAGVYFEVYSPGFELQKRIQVSASLYFRLLQPDTAWLRLWIDTETDMYLTWQDPELDQAMSAHSVDGGSTWDISKGIGTAEIFASQARVFSAQPGSVTRVFRSNNSAQCALYEQAQQTDAQAGMPETWNTPHRILDELNVCPAADQFFQLNGYVLWQWGAGTDQLTWAAYAPNNQSWSALKNQRFNSVDPLTDRQIQMSELQSVLFQDKLVVVGTAFGDVWATTGQFSLQELVFAPPPAWSNAITLQQPGVLPALPALAVDMEGLAHIVMAARDPLGARPQGLSYARWEPQTERAITPASLFTGNLGELAADPFLMVDYQDRLHLVWVGGTAGQVLYSQVSAGEAATPSAWSSPVALGPHTPASSPQLSLDSAGRLYLVYAVTVNEMRGIYLAHSQDGGKTWSSPVRVFDAVAGGMLSVANPSLAATSDGIIHVTWTQAGPPGSQAPYPVWYSHSMGTPETWSEPVALSGNGFDWSKLVTVNDQIHLLYRKQDGSIWHRWARLNKFNDSATLSWTVAAQVPGWRNVGAPFGVVVNGLAPQNLLHLVGIDPGLEQPLYTAWNGSSWSRLEFSASISQAPATSPISAAAPVKGGKLVVNWLAALPDQQPEQIGVHLASRAIPSVMVASLPTLPAVDAPAPAITPSPAPTETAPATQTPAFTTTQPLASSSGGPPPIVMGGGIAAVIVSLALLARSVWKKSNDF